MIFGLGYKKAKKNKGVFVAMKITAFNGSPKGEAGNTNIMVSAFLEGAKAAGAEIESIFLNTKKINYCKACSSCIISGQGKCIIEDDMGDLVNKFVESDVVVLATPLYIDNISGMMKVFIDRFFCIGNPRYETEKDEYGEYKYGKSKRYKNGVPPKVVVISNGSYPYRSGYQTISLWAHTFTRHFRLELIAEIYAAQAAVFELSKAGVKQFEPLVNDLRSSLHKAGQEIVTHMKLSEETQKLLAKDFIPVENYMQLLNKMADMIPKHAKANQ
jgi:multimeric flavodoxin WrbA